MMRGASHPSAEQRRYRPREVLTKQLVRGEVGQEEHEAIRARLESQFRRCKMGGCWGGLGWGGMGLIGLILGLVVFL